MPLTHVYFWEPKIGYRPITVEEADKLYNHNETVPADRTSRFVCGLCAQHVGFSKRRKGTGTRHFYHSKGEDDKECEDRAQLYSRIHVGYTVHPMPMRICVNHGEFRLELGFFHVLSADGSGPRCHMIQITTDQSMRFDYSFERISTEGITYLNVGNIPSANYKLSYERPSPNLNHFWPSSTPGINYKGTFFEFKSGKMLYTGGKAHPYQDYYLLQRSSVSLVPRGISYTELSNTRSGFYTWYLYKIHVHEFSASVARFFLERSIFLTEKPTSFYPVWPPYVEDPYFLYHDESAMYFYMQGGNAELNIYPPQYAPQISSLQDGKLYKIYAASREQLLSLGQSGAMGFSYLMRKELNMTADMPEVQVQSVDGKAMEQNVCNQLPKKKQIIISAPYDGKIVVTRKENIQELRRITANEPITIDELSFECEIRVFQGCDLVRTIRFERPQENGNYREQDRKIVKQLQNARGPAMLVPHSIGAAAVKLKQYPLVKQWLYNAMKKKYISRDAYRIIVHLVNREDGRR